MSGRVVAVIDVGSNSVRLLVARALSLEAFEVIDEERFDARLGDGLVDGGLTPEAFERGITALRLVSEVAASHDPFVTTVVGTEALRGAKNADEFLAAAAAATGLPIRVLSAQEEAEASFLGMINSTDRDEGFAVDIGGGSLELMQFDQRQLAQAQSAPLGAIYAVQRFLRSDPPTGKEIRALRKAVRGAFTIRGEANAVIGVGGAVRNLARMVRLRRRYPLRRLHGLEISRAEMRRLTRELAALPSAARRRLPGVGAPRSDTLHAAAIVLDEIMDSVSAKVLVVSGQGLREGLVWREMRPASPILPDVRRASITGLALANGIDTRAAEPAVAAALTLFDATRSVHGLPSETRELVAAAARLAGIGMHIDYYQRDRHAEYLVHSGDLHGFTHREIVLLAAAVRWAASGTPDLSPYQAIVRPEDGHTAAVLAAMLGTAVAIRRRAHSPLCGFAASIERRELRLSLEGDGRLDAELIALERQQRRLESIHGLPVTVTTRTADRA